MMSKGMNNKIVIVGEGRVGKTSLILRCCKGEYSDNQESTINAFYLEKTIQVNDTENLNMYIWDTAGQERFKSITPMYYHDAVCAIIVYDITFKESFDKVKLWVTELTQILDTSKLIICIVGNKCDLENNRQISKQFAEEYSQSVGAHHFHTSAKNNRGVDELFQYIGQEIFKRKNTNVKKRRGPPIFEDKAQNQQNQRKPCC
ncbi:small guanosine triphosphatase family Ras family protein (macronuclear) [Tetrahymena thermophila SB210]|uniref:Small guanosine triphosphatase family Ras family protein n=2 Tax=Tetrahymena thermophila TaxID=5911 RepID=W7XAN7_TETTS|nr:small guanosine triphosphatase family Ras family protein [Tetrahymena thermophila SB210]EWS76430.1 small guanosine triphosphatase family Ras family protein [Tetrahymena thermophila SB210]|eukprot:XP_012651054.1 small guanosine triphosphatase family Ras family protein [Tetrahymena thermophila SB210]